MKTLGLFVVVLLAWGSPNANAQDACPGTLNHLLSVAGTYNHAQLFDDPAVSVGLDRLLGTELDHLKANVGVSGSVDLIACNLVISGNAEHQGGIEQGIVAVNLVSGAVAAGIYSDGLITVYVDGDNYYAVPLGIRDWLAVVNTDLRFRFELPANARQLAPQGAE
ncbi:MAG: hypothetical protein R3284_03515 [Rubricoccaceae bacterium]|nr:hypothetical protein [Rubricoccaceae bacterium]